MDIESTLRELCVRLKRTGLADSPGRLLYSGVGTLKPGLIYMLGWNPGGDPTVEPETVCQHLEKIKNERPDWNEYIDGYWRPGGRMLGRGRAPMQRRVVNLLRSINIEPRTVFASNLIFARSRDRDSIKNTEHLVQLCWQVHVFLLSIVRPRIILSIGGNAVLEELLRLGKEIGRRDMKESGHDRWICQAVDVRLDQPQVRIVAVPNLSRYAIDRHQDVLRWVKEQITE